MFSLKISGDWFYICFYVLQIYKIIDLIKLIFIRNWKIELTYVYYMLLSHIKMFTNKLSRKLFQNNNIVNFTFIV